MVFNTIQTSCCDFHMHIFSSLLASHVEIHFNRFFNFKFQEKLVSFEPFPFSASGTFTDLLDQAKILGVILSLPFPFTLPPLIHQQVTSVLSSGCIFIQLNHYVHFHLHIVVISHLHFSMYLNGLLVPISAYLQCTTYNIKKIIVMFYLKSICIFSLLWEFKSLPLFIWSHMNQLLIHSPLALSP
jgi:hypothetical protein